jgi:5-methyltetrahydropteroyltriglutamate--homocysteine methyltransferase
MISTTVIGSYPVRLDGVKYADAYYSGVESDAAKQSKDHGDAVAESIREAVGGQVDAGVDIVSDGQTRGHFINIFARNFRGVVIEKKPVVLREIEYRGGSTVDDQLLAKKLLPDTVGLKGIITGPYTMAKSSVNRFYDSTRELAFAYADGLAKEAAALDGVVDYIQVDEPFYSVDYPDYGRELTEKVFGNVGKPRMLHVCGDVGCVFSELVEYEVDVLEHEFAANPQLWETVKDVTFKQKLGVGVVRSDVNKAESVKEIASSSTPTAACAISSRRSRIRS